MRQLAVMNHRLIMLGDEVHARREAESQKVLGPSIANHRQTATDQTIREQTMEDSYSFFNYEGHFESS